MLHSPSISITHCDYQIPNGVREAMLQEAGYAKALLVVEGLYKLKIAPESWLTCAEICRLLSANFGTSQSLVYLGLQMKLVFQRRKAPPQPHQRGARPYLYRIPSPDELAAEFAPGQENTPSDTLCRCDLKSVTAYRMGLHRELFIRLWCKNDGNGFVMCRGLMANRLGVSTRTIRTYDQKLGHSHEANFQENRITWRNWNDLPRYKVAYTPDGKRRPSRYWLKAVDWETGHEATYPFVRYLAYQALKADKLVYKMQRLPNTYYPYPKPDLGRFEDGDVVSHYYADMEARHAAGLYQDSEGKWYHQRE